MYAASKNTLKNKLEGVAEEALNGTDMADLDYAEVATSVSKGTADV